MFLKAWTKDERILFLMFVLTIFETKKADEPWSRSSHKQLRRVVFIECEEVARLSPVDVVLVHFGGRSRWDP